MNAGHPKNQAEHKERHNLIKPVQRQRRHPQQNIHTRETIWARPPEGPSADVGTGRADSLCAEGDL